MSFDSTMQHNRISKFFLAAILGLWLGGLSFYAGIVVPIGTEIVGGMEQGFITQRVSNWLNVMGVLAILALGASMLRRERSWATSVTWSLTASLQIVLLILHPVLDAQLDFASRVVQDGDAFYEWHRIYLIVTTVLWLSGLAHVWLKMGHNADSSSIPSE